MTVRYWPVTVINFVNIYVVAALTIEILQTPSVPIKLALRDKMDIFSIYRVFGNAWTAEKIK